MDRMLLRADAFNDFMKDREERLLALIATATGHQITAADNTSADEQDVPDSVAEDSGILASVA